jgi:SAM-dependent methyltransferase
VFESAAQPLNERIVELAGVKPGHRVLDIATGIGEPALTAARRAGPGGRVLATDLAPPMLAFAEERAREAGLANVEVRVLDAEALDFDPGSFDAATCRWGLMLLQHPRAAASGVHRALAPSGRFAAAVWGPPERAPFLAIPHAVAERELGAPPPPPGAPTAFALAAEGALEAVFQGAGFRSLEAEIFSVAFEFKTAREYAGFLGDLSATLRKSLADQPETVRARVGAEIEREANLHALPDGRVRFVNEVRIVSGTR